MDKRITVTTKTIEEVLEMTKEGYIIECSNGKAIAVLPQEKKPV
jgi:hypothetical protein